MQHFLVSLLSPFVSLLVDVSKSGLGNASLLSHVSGVNGAVNCFGESTGPLRCPARRSISRSLGITRYDRPGRSRRDVGDRRAGEHLLEDMADGDGREAWEHMGNQVSRERT